MLIQLGQGISPDFSSKDGGGGVASMLPSAIADLDVTQVNSYNGSAQTWTNLLGAPADGSSQTDSNFFLGSDAVVRTNDPTFNGTAGDGAAYWSFDGGDHFAKTSPNTAFLNNMHKTSGGSDFWLAFTIYMPSNDGNLLFSTGDFSGFPGLLIRKTNNKLQLAQFGDSGATYATSASDIPVNVPSLLIVSHSHSSNLTRIWVNGDTATEVAQTFNTCITNSSQSQIGKGVSGFGILANGTRLYALSYGNAFISNADAAQLITLYNNRHNRVYA